MLPHTHNIYLVPAPVRRTLANADAGAVGCCPPAAAAAPRSRADVRTTLALAPALLPFPRPPPPAPPRTAESANDTRCCPRPPAPCPSSGCWGGGDRRWGVWSCNSRAAPRCEVAVPGAAPCAPCCWWPCGAMGVRFGVVNSPAPAPPAVAAPAASSPSTPPPSIPDRLGSKCGVRRAEAGNSRGAPPGPPAPPPPPLPMPPGPWPRPWWGVLKMEEAPGPAPTRPSRGPRPNRVDSSNVRLSEAEAAARSDGCGG